MLFGVFVLLTAGLATWTNLDLIAGRPFLYMDEAIPYDGIKAILTADSWSRFCWAIFDGGDHRYGRIFYNISALFSALPYKIFGDPGLIVATRSTQVLLLLTAYVILCRTFLRTWTARALCVFLLCCLPFTAYYLTMPKPEPVQLLLFACFLAVAIRRRFALGGHWVLLGLAFGAKISSAPLCAAAAIAGGITAGLDHSPLKTFLKQSLLSAGAFLAGWLLAVPFLAVPSGEHLNRYLDWTFRGTGHPLDDKSVNVLTWLRAVTDRTYAINYYLPHAIALTFVLALAAYIAIQAVAFVRSRPTLREAWFGHSEWILLGLSVTLLFPIVLLVKRIWGLYLHNGEVLAIVALIAIGERVWLHPVVRAGVGRVTRAASLLMAAVALWTSLSAFPMIWQSYHVGATRTKQPSYVHQFEVYREMVARLDAFSATLVHDGKFSEPIRVFYDPTLFLPDSKQNTKILTFWNHELNWTLGVEVFVISYDFNVGYYMGEKPLPPTSSAMYLPIVKAREQFRAHVGTPGETPGRPYTEAGWLGRDLVVIVRSDLLPTWVSSTEKFPALTPVRPP